MITAPIHRRLALGGFLSSRPPAVAGTGMGEDAARNLARGAKRFLSFPKGVVFIALTWPAGSTYPVKNADAAV
jgi:hypothetical protein